MTSPDETRYLARAVLEAFHQLCRVRLCRYLEINNLESKPYLTDTVRRFSYETLSSYLSSEDLPDSPNDLLPLADRVVECVLADLSF